MTRDEILAFFRERRRAWEAHDPVAIAAGYGERGMTLSPMFGRQVGREAIRESYRALFVAFPDWTMLDEGTLIDGDRVAQTFTVTATHVGEFMGLAGTHRRFQIQGVRIFEFKDGLIQHEQRLYDFTGLLLQVGVLRGKPAKAQ